MERHNPSTLGVVLAGGLSTRFGSDKALAMLDGRTLIDHALAALGRETSDLAVAGRDHPGTPAIPDRPGPGLGPLGGLCGTLHHARAAGYDQVLSCGVDCVALPAGLIGLLGRAPAYLAAQPVIGLWPVQAADALDHFIAADPRRSVRGFAAAIGAVAVESDFVPANVNRPEDLACIRARAGAARGTPKRRS